MTPLSPVEFWKFVILEATLEMLCAAGQNESVEANVLREQMDPMWHRLTDEQREAINQLTIFGNKLEDEAKQVA